MLPGPNQIIACPHCCGLARYGTWLSGSSFGAIVWSDGKQEALGMMPPRPPPVVRCRHCAVYYWLAEGEKVGTVKPWGGEGQQVNPAWNAAQEVEKPTEEEYYQALETNLAKDHQQERSLRVLAWWRRNDGLRFNPVGSATASSACRRNLEALARLLNELVLHHASNDG